ncbi:D-alanine--D-alanine ligase [Parahalioglobus pacificus]|uniref:D-alanine--D-alanine ligase n=1 Tax=Parahalioglobus pacificus TaxID=930806 RepID=A0A918XCN1_9GAMM|nr:D-alanine--D-alanine ligase [Halioglobus pacificus]GHD25984.1 D-alanine--D-alanine ligase B [Halioglobus pacificus]
MSVNLEPDLTPLAGKPVAVLLGGKSAERKVSLNSGATIVEALRALNLDVRAVDTADDSWIDQLHGVGFAFIALHGPGGEDGTIQGALQSMGIPYSGSGVLGSSLAMDKLRTKQLWQGVGVSTGAFVPLAEDSDWEGIIERLGKVFVKPACEGSSIGMTPATNALTLKAAYRAAAEYGTGVIAEQFIDGPEYTVAILGDQALPSIRMETDNEFYDYEAKYLSNDTRYQCPSDLDEYEESQLARLALRAFDTLGCEVWGRVDVMRGANGRFYVLEVNTVPGMTSHSLVPMAARAAHMTIESLVAHIISLSLEQKRNG